MLLGGASGLLAAHPWGGGRNAPNPVGDPGGAILAELSTLKRAVPVDADITDIVRTEPHFTGSCGTTRSSVQVTVFFSSPTSIGGVRSDVAARLNGARWVHYSASGPDRWYDNIGGKQVLADNFIYRWRKRLRQGSTAEAALEVGVPVSGRNRREPLEWTFGAISPAVGGPVMHCGSG